MSKFLLDFTQVDPGQDPLIIIPEVDQDSNAIVLTEPTESLDIIVEAELTNILKAVLALGLDDFNQFESLGLDTIITNAPTLLDSAILHATVSDQLMQVMTDWGVDTVFGMIGHSNSIARRSWPWPTDLTQPSSRPSRAPCVSIRTATGSQSVATTMGLQVCAAVRDGLC